MVIAKIGEKSVTNFRPQWALWKLNSELLNDQEFINRVRIALTTCFSTDLPLFAAWELFKQEHSGYKNWVG